VVAQGGSSSTESNWNLENVDFYGGRKTGEPERKTLEARERINDKLNSHI
jgi:hypothetical protein